MENTFWDKLEKDEELNDEIIEDISKNDLDIYKKDINNSKFIHTEILDSNLEKVYFKDISANGMKMSIIAYINESNYTKYMQIREQINYNIMEILRNEGIELSQRAQTVYVQNS